MSNRSVSPIRQGARGRHSRRRALPLLLFGCAAAALSGVVLRAAVNPQVPLPAATIPQFVQPLPILTAAGGTMATVSGEEPVAVRMCEFWANVLPPGTIAPGVQTKTRVWGYIVGNQCPANGPGAPAIDTYVGPVVLARRGTPTPMTFTNDLGSGASTQVLAYKYSSDQTLHWADPNGTGCMTSMGAPGFGSACAENYLGPVPAVPHLHGGEVPPELDGGPDAWYTSDGSARGPSYYSFPGAAGNAAIYNYPNSQEAAPLWFHDHTLGATRLNVFAGLAGAYLLRDDGQTLPAGLHPYGLQRTGQEPDLMVPLVVQDRSFDTNGQLLMPAGAINGVQLAPNADHPYWVPEFVGDTIVINGKAWPYFDVEPKRYRFLFLNGSNARTYEMFLVDPVTKVMGPAMYVIGSDGGYLDTAVKVDPNAPKGQLRRLTMMPGERYDVIVDFANLPQGTRLVLRNIAKTPYPAGETPHGATLGQMMEFHVGPCTSGACGATDTSYDPAATATIRGAGQTIPRLVTNGAVAASKIRQMTLNEVMGMPMTVTSPITGQVTAYPGGPLEILVNNTKWSGESVRTYGDFTPVSVNGVTTYYSELPTEGATELWEIVNLTADAHPIHLHLVQFQVAGRQGFNTSRYNAAYAAAFPGGVFDPGFGPPLDYRAANNPLSGAKDGGNPDVAPYLQGPVKPPLPNETGWKDTVIVYPGEVTRLAVRWAPTSVAADAPASERYFPFDPHGGGVRGYVWHCHIIDHEDNEMMRPDIVELNPLAPAPGLRLLQKGFDY